MSGEQGGFLREAFFNGNGVAKKLIVALVLFSSVVTAVITAVELYSGYRRDLGQIDRSIEFISKSYLPSLIDSVWVADQQQVQTQLDGLLRLPDIEYLGISVDGQTRWTAGQAVSKRVVAADVPLVREHRGQPLTIGTVRVVASVDRLLARVWDQLLTVLLSNAVKTLLVAGFMLLVFQYLVTRHLTRIAAFVHRIDPAAPHGEEVQLDRPASGRWRPDILDAVTSSINGLSRSLRAAFEGLQQSDERLRVLTRETTAFIYEVDRDGVVVFANRAYPGMTRKQVEGTPLRDWFTPELRPQVDRALARALEGKEPQQVDFTLANAQGEPRSYVASMVPILREGAVTSVALTSLDISEQKAAEKEIRDLNRGLEVRVRERTAELQQAMERAESASRAKSEFLSHMSHELRTPMNAILGFAQIIQMSNPTPQQLKWAGEIRRAGDHLLQMIEDLLDMARIEVGKMSIQPEALELEPVLAESLAIVQPLISARGIQLAIVGCREAGQRVHADRLRLRQILVNLLSNAAKYNRTHGSITVNCRTSPEGTRLSVTDTGAGIPPEKLARLFQPFERLGAELGGIDGSGIGLALSKKMAEMMGATLGCDSQVDVGSTFWIDLPHAVGSAAQVAAPVAAPYAMRALPLDVIYIEDNRSNLELMAAFLATHAQVQLRSATTGHAGLALVTEKRPDVILLDIHLPGMNGHEVLQRLRADPALRDIPVIALSADAMPHDVQRGLAAGFDRYIAKPVNLSQLLDTIGEILRDGRAPRMQR